MYIAVFNLLQEARTLLINSLSSSVITTTLDTSIYQLKLIFNTGITLYIRYNDFKEYGYQIMYSSRKFDYARFDNYDDRWSVSTRPHHFHPKGQKPVSASPMTGITIDDIPKLIRFLEGEDISI